MAQLPNMNWMGDQPTGSAYDVYQYYLGGGSPGGTTPTSGGGGGIMQTIPPYLQPGGGGDQSGLGRRFGNLDLSKSKTFDKEVFSRDMIDMSPIEAARQGLTTPTNSWQNKQVTGYMNPKTGQYQTFEGKNINHLGIEVPSLIGALFDKDLGKGPQIGDIKGTFTDGWDEGLENIKEGTEEWFEAVKNKVGWGKKKAKKALDHKKHVAALELKEKQKEDRKKEELAKNAGPVTTGGGGVFNPAMDPKGRGNTKDSWHGATASRQAAGKQVAGPGFGQGAYWAEGGMITDLTKDPEYRGWKKMYEANPEVGSMHEKHPTFIKFYKQNERDKKKFGGLAGLLYG